MLTRIWCLCFILLMNANGLAAQESDAIFLTDFQLCQNGRVKPEKAVYVFSECLSVKKHHINLNRKTVWLKSSFIAPKSLMQSDKPIGLFISAAASSKIYLNGTLLAQNGMPSTEAGSETPGKLDFIAYLPQNVLKQGRNELILLMSGHNNILNLENSLQRVVIGPHAEPKDLVLRHYISSFLPLGILLSGAFYFGFSAIKTGLSTNNILIPLAAIFSSAQLISEISRGLISYSYPANDVRLILIVVFALASGLCLLLHVTGRFFPSYKWLTSLSSVAVITIILTTLNSFDQIILVSIMGPALAAGIIALYALKQSQVKARHYTIALFSFVSLGAVMQGSFIDITYYYLIAGLLLFLFSEQVHEIMKEKEQRQIEKTRANHLQQVLDRLNEEEKPSSLKVSHLGKTEIIQKMDIAYCKGARDYVELILVSGRTILSKTTMGQLESELSANFLKVHRSYLVNTSQIASLDREANSSGTLHLQNGASLPVSRRVMPSLRKSL